MTFAPGQTVALGGVDLVGQVVKRRLPNEDVYLIHVDEQNLYISAARLTLLEDSAEHTPSFNRTEEIANLGRLLQSYSDESILEQVGRAEIIDSLRKLGIVIPLPKGAKS